MNIVFFGSFQHYSAYILEALIQNPEITVSGVVTTPPMPVGRKKIITKTPVHVLAEKNGIQVWTPEKLSSNFQFSIFNSSIDYFVTAGYGKMLSKEWLEYPKLGCLNLHFSLLPKYRGANPAEWAIMCGETETGITLMKMNEGLDTGDIIAQSKIPITNTDTRESIYEKLYRLGAQELPKWLNSPNTLATLKPQGESGTPYSALLKRADGYIPWNIIQGDSLKDIPSKHLQTAFTSNRNLLQVLPRALAGYPSLWTIVPTTKGEKRMKILSFEPYIVQIEGQQPSHFKQIKNQLTK